MNYFYYNMYKNRLKYIYICIHADHDKYAYGVCIIKQYMFIVIHFHTYRDIFLH